MKKSLLPHVLLMTRYLFLVFLAFCLSISLLFASSGDYKAKSIEIKASLAISNNKPIVIEPTKEVDIIVSGTVTDINGEPIPGVTVSVSGASIGTSTDLDGEYSLSVPEGSTLGQLGRFLQKN